MTHNKQSTDVNQRHHHPPQRQDSSAPIVFGTSDVIESQTFAPANQQPSLFACAKRWFSAKKAAEELRDPMFWHDVIVETLLCVFFECSVIWIGVTCNRNAYVPSPFQFAIYAGFFVFTLVEGWSPLSGVAVNPVRTWSCFLTGQFSPVKSKVGCSFVFVYLYLYSLLCMNHRECGGMLGCGLSCLI